MEWKGCLGIGWGRTAGFHGVNQKRYFKYIFRRAWVTFLFSKFTASRVRLAPREVKHDPVVYQETSLLVSLGLKGRIYFPYPAALMSRNSHSLCLGQNLFVLSYAELGSFFFLGHTKFFPFPRWLFKHRWLPSGLSLNFTSSKSYLAILYKQGSSGTPRLEHLYPNWAVA